MPESQTRAKQRCDYSGSQPWQKNQFRGLKINTDSQAFVSRCLYHKVWEEIQESEFLKSTSGFFFFPHNMQKGSQDKTSFTTERWATGMKIEGGCLPPPGSCPFSGSCGCTGGSARLVSWVRGSWVHPGGPRSPAASLVAYQRDPGSWWPEFIHRFSRAHPETQEPPRVENWKRGDAANTSQSWGRISRVLAL